MRLAALLAICLTISPWDRLAAQRKTPSRKAPSRKALPRAEQVQKEAVRVARLEYQARAARLPKDDVVGHFALAQWCAKKQLPRCQRWELHEVLREHPDHAAARKLLGQVSYKGQWLPEATAKRRAGLILFEGVWRKKHDVARLKHARAAAKPDRLGFQRRANRLLVKLADRDPKIRRASLTALLALAKRHDNTEFAALARQVHGDYDRFWSRQAVARALRPVGVMSISATHSKLIEMKNHSTSLGVGSPVTIQLPQMRTVSINTTVAVPLGFGR